MLDQNLSQKVVFGWWYWVSALIFILYKNGKMSFLPWAFPLKKIQ